MKVRINYDLFEKIQESRIGISFKRKTYNFFKGLPIALSVYGLVELCQTGYINLSHILLVIPISLLFDIFHASLSNSFLQKSNMKVAFNELSKLSNEISSLNISTTPELLKDSKEYHTHYEIKFSKRKLPVLMQQKYIMIRTNKDEEVSIVQEHCIGSKKWEISHGSPEKVYKLSLATQSTL